jgi:hypothetical protein
MKVTKSELYNALIEARVALTLNIRETLRGRRHSYTPNLLRKSVREKIAAYRLLSNLSEIDAETYTHSKRDMARVKKALGI